MFAFMRCINPFRKKNPQYPEFSDLRYIDCPCGKCFPCLVNRRRGWFFRLYNESLCSSSTWFITLTYDDNHNDGFLHREHLTKFLKRLRHKCNFRFYGIGEFGTTTFRPHYHLILFLDSFNYDLVSNISLDEQVELMISLLWDYGFTLCKRSNPSALNYVLHYHVRPKFPFGVNVKDKKTFCSFSKRLGIGFLFDDNGNFKYDIANMLMTSSNRAVSNGLGSTFIIPRYYVKKAEEFGLPIFNDYSNCDYSFANNPVNILVRNMFPDIQFDEFTGYPIGMSFKDYNQLVEDIFSRDSIKLCKYNYQSKNSI